MQPAVHARGHCFAQRRPAAALWGSPAAAQHATACRHVSLVVRRGWAAAGAGACRFQAAAPTSSTHITPAAAAAARQAESHPASLIVDSTGSLSQPTFPQYRRGAAAGMGVALRAQLALTSTATRGKQTAAGALRSDASASTRTMRPAVGQLQRGAWSSLREWHAGCMVLGGALAPRRLLQGAAAGREGRGWLYAGCRVVRRGRWPRGPPGRSRGGPGGAPRAPRRRALASLASAGLTWRPELLHWPAAPGKRQAAMPRPARPSWLRGLRQRRHGGSGASASEAIVPRP